VLLVCSPALSCLAGSASVSKLSPQVVDRVFAIADSATEFSGIQGKNGWFYGFMEPDKEAKFTLMSDCREDHWGEGDKDVVEGTWRVDEEKYWTMLQAASKPVMCLLERSAHRLGKTNRLTESRWIWRWVRRAIAG